MRTGRTGAVCGRHDRGGHGTVRLAGFLRQRAGRSARQVAGPYLMLRNPFSSTVRDSSRPASTSGAGAGAGKALLAGALAVAVGSAVWVAKTLDPARSWMC